MRRVRIDRFSQAGEGRFGIADGPHSTCAMRRSRAGAEVASLDSQISRDGPNEMEQGQHQRKRDCRKKCHGKSVMVQRQLVIRSNALGRWT